MNAISMSLLLDALRSLDECSRVPRIDDSFIYRVDISGRAHSAAFRLRLALSQMPDVAIEDDREQVTQ